MQKIKRLYFIIVLFIVSLKSFAQPVQDTSVIDVAKIMANENIFSRVFFYADLGRKQTIGEIGKNPFNETLNKSIINWKRIPNKYITANLYYKFTLTNTSDSLQSFYFNPGGYFQVFEIYKLNESGPESFKIHKAIENVNEALNHGYKPLQLAPGETSIFLIKLRFVKTTVNYVNPK
ncbi:MAG: hypothetical protein ACM3H8_08945, partial [Sphingobacteriales bacterium]